MRRCRSQLLSAACLLTLLLPSLAHAKVKIVATVGDLATMAEEVGGKHVKVKRLASPQEDPHFVDAKPSFVRHVAEADLLVVNGMALEIGWLPTLVKNSRNSKIQKGDDGYFDASQHIERKGVRTGKVSRAEGDVHPQGNPHYSLEPSQMARVALAFGKKLAEIDPDHAAFYKKNAKKLARSGLQMAKYWGEQFKAVDKKCRRVVVYHEAWIYLTEWLDLEVVMPVEPKPGVAPNPKHVAKVFQTMKKDNIPVVIQMEYYPNSNTEMITKRTGAYLLRVEGHARDDQDYETRVNKMAGELYSAVLSRCK